MVSQRTRNAVWQNYLDVARLGLYYEALADRYRRRYIFLRVALLLSVLGSVASPLTPLSHPVVTTALVIATVALVAADYALDFAKKSAVLHQINVEVLRLEGEWEGLWLSVDDDTADELEVRAENRNLESRVLDATKRCGDEGIPIDNKLNQKCMETAYEVAEGRFQYAHGE